MPLIKRYYPNFTSFKGFSQLNFLSIIVREKIMMKLQENFGKRVKQLRKRKGWTQEDLGDKANIDYKYIGAIERGEKNLTINNVEKIAKAFRTEPFQLFLFSSKGLIDEKAITEKKIKNLLKLSKNREKKFILQFIANFLKYSNL